jgi:tetratricopeptide (TPR) repeat protein
MTAAENGSLADQRIAFTGKAISFTREQACQVVESRGGIFQPVVNESTSLLVVGAAGWPLQNNGRITRNLELAERFRRNGFSIQIETEEDFLSRLGTDASSLTKNYSLPQLSRLLQITPQQLQAWFRLGLLEPSSKLAGIAYFDFQQVVRCKTLAKLAQSRVGIRRLRRAVKVLKRHSLDSSVLDRLVLLDSHVAIRQVSGSLSSINGQLLFDFCESDTASTLPTDTAMDTEFEDAVACELSGRLDDAEEIYRKLLEKQPDDCDVLFNLGNVLTEQSRVEEAIAEYHKAVYLDPEFKEAWNNLGNALRETEKLSESLLAYQRAIMIDMDYPAAIYGLACALDQVGRHREAESYWTSYLELEPEGDCAQYARQRLHDETSSRL